MMTSQQNPRPTTDELFELLRRTSLPTVIVEGNDDIIFYRAIEEELRSYGVDMLPAGNKGAVLELKIRLSAADHPAPIVFVVDKDLWVLQGEDLGEKAEGVVTTLGYSVENDLYLDGDLEALLSIEERAMFHQELRKFVGWYALSVARVLSGSDAAFRTHPGKVLDDAEFFSAEMRMQEGEAYPHDLHDRIIGSYITLVRGKSLLAVLSRRLCEKRRAVRFSYKQLIAFGASRRGPNFQRLCDLIRSELPAPNA